MELLSQRTHELISRGLKTAGKNIDAYFYIEEELYADEAAEVYSFFEWLIKTDRPFGRINAQERWSEFKTELNK